MCLAACGGGGGSGSTPPPVPPTPAPNGAPSITAPPAEVLVQENTESVVFAVQANDPDGDSLTYTLSGEDAAAFTVSATGALRFAEPPDFEAPGDADADNTYRLSVMASDPSGANATAALVVRVTDEAYPEAGLLRQRLFDDISVTRNREYAPGLFADVFTARGATDTQRPLIIFASGGGFIVEDRRTVEPIALDFAQRGYLAATIDYRTLNRFPRNEEEAQVAATKAVHDLFAAVRSARAAEGFATGFAFDPDLIVVGGESAGGVMAVTAAALDPDDTISAPAIADYLAANGGVYGDVGDHDAEDSAVQAALPLSGAVFDLAIIDAKTAPTFGAHEENDRTVRCDTGAEGATGTNTVLVGTCDFVPDMQAKGVAADSLIIPDDAGHVDFTAEERADIYEGAAALFVEALYGDDSL